MHQFHVLKAQDIRRVFERSIETCFGGNIETRSQEMACIQAVSDAHATLPGEQLANGVQFLKVRSDLRTAADGILQQHCNCFRVQAARGFG